MGQMVWYKQDIENILRGVERSVVLTVQQVSADDQTTLAYIAGVQAALSATAEIFGIPLALGGSNSVLPPAVTGGQRYRR